MEWVLPLALLVGLSLGLFGGGGSILTVPILVYAAGVEPRPAIATSLLIVGLTSAAALLPHARAGHVRWGTGALFGATGMAGAWAGGRAAAFLPGGVLLLLFAGAMAASALALWRDRAAPPPGARPGCGSSLRAAADGLAIGGFTGLVGAGGGFLVVPALALRGGLPMPAAVGTSLLVIAAKSFAGLAGYLAHVRIDLPLALSFSAAAVAGSLAGARLTRAVRPERLRRGFSSFVLALAACVLARELTAGAGADLLVALESQRRASTVLILHQLAPLPWPAAGAALGALVLLLLWSTQKRFGISTGLENLCALALRTPYFRRSEITGSRGWRLPFLGGLVLGGFLSAATSGGFSPFWDLGMFDARFGWGPAGKLAWMFAGGVLIGFGTRLADGCTSGHGIFGLSNLERAGLASTLAFLAAGIATSHLVYGLGRF